MGGGGGRQGLESEPWASLGGVSQTQTLGRILEGSQEQGGPACRHPEEGLGSWGVSGSVGCGSRDYKVAQVALGRSGHSSSPERRSHPPIVDGRGHWEVTTFLQF